MTTASKAQIEAAAQKAIEAYNQPEVKNKSESMSAWDDRFTGSAKEIEAHTIERCAQVAEQILGSADDDLGVAAAIRRLKEAGD